MLSSPRAAPAAADGGAEQAAVVAVGAGWDAAELAAAAAVALEVPEGDVAVAVAADATAARASADELLQASAGAGGCEAEGDPEPLADAARVLLLSGAMLEVSQELRHLLLWEVDAPPFVMGALQPERRGEPVGDVAASLAASHARYWGLAADAEDPFPPPTGDWTPADATVAMHLALDAGCVPTADGRGERLDAGHVVVLDDVLDDEHARELLDALTEPGWDHSSGAPPASRWAREVTDLQDEDEEDDDEDEEWVGEGVPKRPDVPPSWGLRMEAREELAGDGAPAALRELRARIAALYPEWDVRTMPSDALESDGVGVGGGGLAPLVGNAAVAGDVFQWHRDYEPAETGADTPWAEQHGVYVNREPGRPLFVSALVYLDAEWPENFDAETLFLDPPSGTGVFVRPRPGRVVLMEQDVLHRVSAPSVLAGRPRYSLVLKLVFYPKPGHELAVASISRPDDWGAATRFGSAAAAAACSSEP